MIFWSEFFMLLRVKPNYHTCHAQSTAIFCIFWLFLVCTLIGIIVKLSNLAEQRHDFLVGICDAPEDHAKLSYLLCPICGYFLHFLALFGTLIGIIVKVSNLTKGRHDFLVGICDAPEGHAKLSYL